MHKLARGKICMIKEGYLGNITMQGAQFVRILNKGTNMIANPLQNYFTYNSCKMSHSTLDKVIAIGTIDELTCPYTIAKCQNFQVPLSCQHLLSTGPDKIVQNHLLHGSFLNHWLTHLHYITQTT